MSRRMFLLAVSIAGLATVGHVFVRAQSIETSYRLPPAILMDNVGPIGQIVDFTATGPTILLEEEGRRFPITAVGPDRFETSLVVWYTTGDCTGTAYVRRPEERGGWWAFIGASYAFRGNMLYRGLQADPTAPVAINSRWSARPNSCIAAGTGDDVIRATAFDNTLRSRFR